MASNFETRAQPVAPNVTHKFEKTVPEGGYETSSVFIVATICWLSCLVCLMVLPFTTKLEERLPLPSFTPTSVDAVHIVYASGDKASNVGAEASIRSVRKHASEPVVIYFIGNTPVSLSDVTFIRLSDVSERYNLKRFMNEATREYHGGRLHTDANFVRFVLPSLFPTLPKVLWLDTDTFIQCDIVPLVRDALSNCSHAVAAIPREGINGIEQWYLDEEQIDIQHSFNAGVSIMDLKRWRERRLSQKVYSLVRLDRNGERSIYHLGSQPPMNLAIGDDFEHLPLKWNVDGLGYKRGLRAKQMKKNSCLLHWNGRWKPWLPNGWYKQLWDSSGVLPGDEVKPGNEVKRQRRRKRAKAT